MIDQAALGQFIYATFIPHVSIIAGAVISITLTLLFYLFLRERFLYPSTRIKENLDA